MSYTDTSIRCCIFDLDGVICDTARFHYEAWKELADQLGIPFSLEDNERLKGISRMESLDILLSLGPVVASEEEKKRLAEQKNQIYIGLIQTIHAGHLLPGILDFLKDLKAHDILIGLGSVSKNATAILNRLEITNYFDCIGDGYSVANAKPAPDIFLYSADKLNIPPENCLVFEDAASGIQAARQAGMKCIGVNVPDFYMADYVLTTFNNITWHSLRSCLFETSAAQICPA